jgi:hypothetical protein
MKESRKRIRFQFRLRTLLVFVCLAGPIVAWLLVPAVRWLLEPDGQTTHSLQACPAVKGPMNTTQCFQCHTSIGKAVSPTTTAASAHPFVSSDQQAMNCAQCHQTSALARLTP